MSAWVVAGARRPEYSPVDEAISRLAAVDAPGRATMTAGFIAFGVGVPLCAAALRKALPGPAWVAATVTGLSTLAVAALPLDRGVDTAHGVAAVTGYASLAAVPLLAAPSLRRAGRPGAARVSVAVGAASATALAATVVSSHNGLWQRTGLTLTDAWLVAVSAAIVVRGRLERGLTGTDP